MQAPQKFATRGFIVLYTAVPDRLIDELRTEIRHNKTLPWYSDIFDDNYAEENRIQAPVPDPLARELNRDLKRFYKTFFPLSQPNDWRFVKTLADSADQYARRDFQPTEHEAEVMNVCAMPGLIMIATEPDTFLYTFGWTPNVALKSNRHLLTLSKGDIVMFRGDLIYQPVGYRTNNLTLYAYLDPLEYTRPEIHHPHVFTIIDDTRSNDDPFCFVWNCGFKGENMNSVRKHLNRFHHFHFNEKRRKHDTEESLVIE